MSVLFATGAAFAGTNDYQTGTFANDTVVPADTAKTDSAGLPAFTCLADTVAPADTAKAEPVGETPAQPAFVCLADTVAPADTTKTEPVGETPEQPVPPVF